MGLDLLLMDALVARRVAVLVNYPSFVSVYVFFYLTD